MLARILTAISILAIIALLAYFYLNKEEECAPIPEGLWRAVYPNTDWASGSFYAQAPVSECLCQNLIMNNPNAPGGVYDSHVGACYLKSSMGQGSRIDGAASRFTSYIKN